MNRGHVLRPRDIIDHDQLAASLAEAAAGPSPRAGVTTLLRAALRHGRAELASRLLAQPLSGHEITRSYTHLIDRLVQAIVTHTVARTFPLHNPTSAERLAVVAVGGYGRAEMAPHSDVDVAFITPTRRTPWCEQVIETVLHHLWDLGLKVGHASRSVSETVHIARQDLTVRTALLESRLVCGDDDVFAQVEERLRREVMDGTAAEFVAAKLAEREARHQRLGNSRYVVEPNVKDGKGGLRDLQALYWIGKYCHRVNSAFELVAAGLFTPGEYRSFRRAESFLLAVRCHLHDLAGRAEERVGFAAQRQIAARMGFADRPGRSATELFMQTYFRHARRVGSLTGVFLAHLDEEMNRSRRRTGLLAAFRARPRPLGGYRVFGGRIAAPADDWFRKDPRRLVEIFHLAERNRLEIHPHTLRLLTRDAVLIRSALRHDPRANALFLELLTGRNDPETTLRWMNDTGVLGRFLPDFGRITAQMQFDMYHHYTVDEHTIRAIGLLSRLEKGELAADHPHETRLFGEVTQRRVTYVAVLLHDIAKGRGGDHSILGAEVAERLCPRLGLSTGETAQVAWLVRHHLLLSHTAFRRDTSDPQTVEDFAGRVASLERLRHLAVLTAVDIHAVGPARWNSWKAQLLASLYEATEERLRLGHLRHSRAERIAARRRATRECLGDDAVLVDRFGEELGDAFWIAEAPEVIAANLRLLDRAQRSPDPAAIACRVDAERGATLVTVVARDAPGLFYRIAGAIHLAGGNVIDARIHTTAAGWAIDNFLVQSPHGALLDEPRQLERLSRTITHALSDRLPLAELLAARPLPDRRMSAFPVAPNVLFDNAASRRFTVVEVIARDSPALLYRLARGLFDADLRVHSAHITAYGERVADTFYVTDAQGAKVTSASRLRGIEARLLAAAGDASTTRLSAA
ncbi:[protein-PII] uridylyltransferase [Erythrobacteraceae bacterium CFH 75059]|uniref:[protein-PII] uridylyltransferase n=1 Tax=Qipengyuania thermophila TaxID=2509361 RepID=UPI0010207FDA|nr:[protein-PII] uridylyltransferase [Qipengyuania thermophila]TCD06512.1 [protein-PII] uridylyltransferase [Erythrobacteraceae bacterium CFH 75059]